MSAHLDEYKDSASKIFHDVYTCSRGRPASCSSRGWEVLLPAARSTAKVCRADQPHDDILTATMIDLRHSEQPFGWREA